MSLDFYISAIKDNKYYKSFQITYNKKILPNITLEQAKSIYETINDNKIIDYKDSKYYLSVAIYYLTQRNYKLFEEFAIKSVSLDNDEAMFILGCHYQDSFKYDLMKKYYSMAISKGEVKSMFNLGSYFFETKKYDQMKVYFNMAIEKGEVSSMNNLGKYYEEVEKNYDLMKKYYLMAIEKVGEENLISSCTAMNNLGKYYEEVEKNYDLMKKYYLMAIEYKDTEATKSLEEYYENNKGDSCSLGYDADGKRVCLSCS